MYFQQSPSAYAYLEARFGLATRLLASLAFTVQMVMYMGIVVYAPSLALATVTGLDYHASVLSVGLVCTFYSTLGNTLVHFWIWATIFEQDSRDAYA